MTNFAAEIENNMMATSLGKSSRHFFEAMALPSLKQSNRHVNSLEGAVVIDETWTGSRGLSDHWTLTFSCHGHRFLIDTNHHAAMSEFFVADSECPIDVLTDVLVHFNKLSPLLINEQDRRNAVRWVWLIAFAVFVASLLSIAMILLGEAPGDAGSNGRSEGRPAHSREMSCVPFFCSHGELTVFVAFVSSCPTEGNEESNGNRQAAC